MQVVSRDFYRGAAKQIRCFADLDGGRCVISFIIMAPTWDNPSKPLKKWTHWMNNNHFIILKILYKHLSRLGEVVTLEHTIGGVMSVSNCSRHMHTRPITPSAMSDLAICLLPKSFTDPSESISVHANDHADLNENRGATRIGWEIPQQCTMVQMRAFAPFCPIVPVQSQAKYQM